MRSICVVLAILVSLLLFAPTPAFSTDPPINQAGWHVLYVDSQATDCGNYGATNAFDGNTGTMWVTGWCHAVPPTPHDIQIDLGAGYNITGFQYLPRQDPYFNGNIRDYEFYVSSDGVNWGSAVSSGTLITTTSDKSLKQATFSTVVGRYVRFRALSEVNGGPWSNAAELNVLGTLISVSGPQVASVTLNPTTIAGGGYTSTGTVTLSAAPTSNAVISLSSSNPGTATVPATITISANATSATFTIASGVVIGATSLAVINATYNSSTGAAIATVTPTIVPRSGWHVLYVDSDALDCGNFGAANAFDGNTGTMWVTEWCHSAPYPPHEIQIDLGASYNISGFQYLPRQDQSFNGNIRNYEFYVSSDGVNWGSAVSSGTLITTTSDKAQKQVTFSTVVGRYVRLRALSEVNGGPWTNAAEINVLGTLYSPPVGPTIASVIPASAAPGTSVTILGTGFGAAQGTGNVWLGSTYGIIGTWTDTEIHAKVASNSLTGTVKVLQGGVWSTAVDFTVVGGHTITGVKVVPTLMSLVVGETRIVEALDSTGALVNGLAWESSDPTIVSISTDDPPVITAKAAGHVTITAADGTADVTVYAGPSLPVGTVKWSQPGDGSGVSLILPAVPSDHGVADVFALQTSGKVQAITADGHVAWTADVSGSENILPDFQGGLAVVNYSSGGSNSLASTARSNGRFHASPRNRTIPFNVSVSGGRQFNASTASSSSPFGSMYTLDGVTGQPYPAYSYVNDSGGYLRTAAGHTDGTIFTVDGDTLVGIDPLLGTAKIRVQMEHSTMDDMYGSHSDMPPDVGTLIIAGDGYAYVPYRFSRDDYRPTGNALSHNESHIRLLRVATDGSNSSIPVADWSQHRTQTTLQYGWEYTTVQSGMHPATDYIDSITALLTNADTGVVLSWKSSNPAYCASEIWDYRTETTTYTGCVPVTESYRLATTSGSSLVGDVPLSIAAQSSILIPALQKSDGTFIGTMAGGIDLSGLQQNSLFVFDSGGNIAWSKSGGAYWPYMATADGNVLVDSQASATDPVMLLTLDGSGNETARVPEDGSVLSWTANTYQYGSVIQVAATPRGLAPSFAANAGDTSAVVRYEPPQSGLRTIARTNLSAQPACDTFLANLTAIARSNGRLPQNSSLTKAVLISEIQSTAETSRDYIYDGPTSNTLWEQCTQPSCVAKFPVWFTGEQKADGYLVKQEFEDNGPGSGHYLEGLAQYDGSAMWLRVFGDWSGAWKGLTSQYIATLSLSKAGQVNSYGLGTLLHEVLHKRSVGGGFTHADMAQALDISSCMGSGAHNGCSEAIATKCFPN